MEALSSDEIEMQVRLLPTSRKRINARRKLRVSTNAQLDVEILAFRDKVRTLKVSGAKECDLRRIYSDITHLEMRYLLDQCGNKY
jgi:hypothetical protein